jgi:hypothetical protein
MLQALKSNSEPHKHLYINKPNNLCETNCLKYTHY